MRECRKCQTSIPRSIVIEGKRRNLSNRKFCFDCSPWGSRNTKANIDAPPSGRKDAYHLMTKEARKKHCKRTYEDQKERRFNRKKKFVLLLGGECKHCGYKKNLACLAFHHRNPEEKNFPLSSKELGMYKEERLLEEVAKCDLLCHNCHVELHNPSFGIWR